LRDSGNDRISSARRNGTRSLSLTRGLHLRVRSIAVGDLQIVIAAETQENQNGLLHGFNGCEVSRLYAARSTVPRNTLAANSCVIVVDFDEFEQ
jgi:hypothetical protein